jgi:4-diphosphocytidyl-2-C-methyl-D-erythritol kinase
MMGSGRGEILEPFPLDLGDLRLEVVVPEGISVSTADAYRGIVPRIPEKPLAEILRQDPSTWKEELRNDFEETVFKKYPELAAIKADLYAKGALYCAMSGSGSSLYTLFRP